MESGGLVYPGVGRPSHTVCRATCTVLSCSPPGLYQCWDEGRSLEEGRVSLKGGRSFCLTVWWGREPREVCVCLLCQSWRAALIPPWHMGCPCAGPFPSRVAEGTRGGKNTKSIYV